MTVLCAICKRKSRGFGWMNPLFKIFDKRKDKTRRKFCSMECMNRWASFMKKEGYPMIDPSKQEKEAMEAAIQPLAEYVTEIGMHRPLQDYSRGEILTMIEVVITGYQDYLFANFPDNQPKPKKKH